MRAFILLSLVTVLAAGCSFNNVKEDKSLAKFFTDNKVEGCFALMDNGTGQFTVYNLPRFRDSSYLPASTFKIVNSLIGLQTGKISSDSMIIPWDGVERSFPGWNKDLTMYEAFRVSSLPYYQEVARRVGKDTMQFWLDSLGYGAKNDKEKVRIKTTVDSFWIDNSIKVSPDAQLGLVKRLYFDQLPFFKTYQGMVKRAMLFEDNTKYRLAYKTGWGYAENGNMIGWVVGWIEENNHPYFFVLNLETPDPNFDMVGTRMNILKGILKEQDFFEGKR